jgi:hypothetical protein
MTPRPFHGAQLYAWRRGFAAQAYAAGVDELAIMRHGRWRSAAVMRTYIAEADRHRLESPVSALGLGAGPEGAIGPGRGWSARLALAGSRRGCGGLTQGVGDQVRPSRAAGGAAAGRPTMCLRCVGPVTISSMRAASSTGIDRNGE